MHSSNCKVHGEEKAVLKGQNSINTCGINTLMRERCHKKVGVNITDVL